jgi:lipid-binding SYLF domain-containing protein
MTRFSLLTALLLLPLTAAATWAAERELKTVTAATEVGHQFSDIPLHCIPPALLHQATGVVVLPNVVKAGLVFDGRFGHGVALVRQPDGTWSNPVFVTLKGLGVGGQAGVGSSDLVLVFKTPNSLNRILYGKRKLTLGGDASIAAGPVGREAELATDALLKAEILSYSRSRGLFIGVSLEGSSLAVDREANEAFYGLPGGYPAHGMTHVGVEATEALRGELQRVSTPPPVVVPPPAIVGPGPPPAVILPASPPVNPPPAPLPR